MGRFQDTKQKLIDFLYSRKEYIRAVDNVEYQTRCPYCGDSQKDFRTGHLYLRIDIYDDYKIPMTCFKCECGGDRTLTDETLELMGCTDDQLKDEIRILNRRGESYKGETEYSGYVYIERNMPEKQRYPNKIKYIENRLGCEFDEIQLRKMKIITSLYDFLIANDVRESVFHKNIRMLLERDYIGFLSGGNTHILFRDITNKNKFPWIKYPIEKKCRKYRVYYGLDSEVNIYDDQRIIVNLSEGVMDALGIGFHFDHIHMNEMNLAICGKHFDRMIRHLIDIGIFGGNVELNIYADNDFIYNHKSQNDGPTEQTHRKYLKKYRPLFSGIYLNYNLGSKDFGIIKDKIFIERKKI